MRLFQDMRRIRRLTQVLLTLIGTAIVLYAVLAVSSTYTRVLLVALGLILLEAGIWEITRSLFPNEREFRPLRKETDYFLTIVRRMNRASVRARSGGGVSARTGVALSLIGLATSRTGGSLRGMGIAGDFAGNVVLGAGTLAHPVPIAAPIIEARPQGARRYKFRMRTSC